MSSEWMENFQCIPKCIVGDMAFTNGDAQTLYIHHGIHFIATGPRTPWPNRAKSAVRLFRRTFDILSTAKLDPTLPTRYIF